MSAPQISIIQGNDPHRKKYKNLLCSGNGTLLGKHMGRKMSHFRFIRVFIFPELLLLTEGLNE